MCVYVTPPGSPANEYSSDIKKQHWERAGTSMKRVHHQRRTYYEHTIEVLKNRRNLSYRPVSQDMLASLTAIRMFDANEFQQLRDWLVQYGGIFSKPRQKATEVSPHGGKKRITDKQRDYILSLCRKHEHPYANGWREMALRRELTVKEASEIIDLLRDSPRKKGLPRCFDCGSIDGKYCSESVLTCPDWD